MYDAQEILENVKSVLQNLFNRSILEIEIEHITQEEQEAAQYGGISSI